MIWMRELLEKLKKAQVEAVERGQRQFVFEGQDVLVAYAKYLIEYLEGVLKPREGARR